MENDTVENEDYERPNLAVVGQQSQLDTIENKVDAILSIMVAIAEQAEEFKSVFAELENSPAGNMVMNMLGLKR